MSTSHGVQSGSGTIFRYSFTEQQSTTELSLCQTVTSRIIFWIRVRTEKEREGKRETKKTE
jgi:hypothetical protein